MDSNALRTFIAVAENHSFSAAAEQLFLTQPAVSKRIATLESELKTLLFDRIGKSVYLTQSGQILLQHANRVLQQLKNCQTEILNLSEIISGKLNIATSHHIGLHRLPSLLKKFTSRYPNVELNIHFLDSERACQSVLDGEIEIAIITLPNNCVKHLMHIELWQDPMEIVVARNSSYIDHTLSTKPRLNLSKKEFRRSIAPHPCILPEKNTYTRNLIERQFQQYRVEARFSMATNYLETIKMLVSVGLGWSVLPATMIGKELTILEVDGMNFSRHLGAVLHKKRTRSNVTSAFLSLITTELGRR